MSIPETVAALADDAIGYAESAETIDIAAALYRHLVARAGGRPIKYGLAAAQLLIGLLLSNAPNDKATEIGIKLASEMPLDQLRALRLLLDGGR